MHAGTMGKKSGQPSAPFRDGTGNPLGLQLTEEQSLSLGLGMCDGLARLSLQGCANKRILTMNKVHSKEISDLGHVWFGGEILEDEKAEPQLRAKRLRHSPVRSTDEAVKKARETMRLLALSCSSRAGVVAQDREILATCIEICELELSVGQDECQYWPSYYPPPALVADKRRRFQHSLSDLSEEERAFLAAYLLSMPRHRQARADSCMSELFEQVVRTLEPCCIESSSTSGRVLALACVKLLNIHDFDTYFVPDIDRVRHYDAGVAKAWHATSLIPTAWRGWHELAGWLLHHPRYQKGISNSDLLDLGASHCGLSGMLVTVPPLPVNRTLADALLRALPRMYQDGVQFRPACEAALAACRKLADDEGQQLAAAFLASAKPPSRAFAQAGHCEEVARIDKMLNKDDTEELGCAFCGGPATTQCSGCHLVRYCSFAHQKADWKKHKLSCRK